MNKGIIIKTDNTWEVVEYENDFRYLQKVVDGLIEFVEVGEGIDMVINDEGKLLDLDLNPLATILYSCKDAIVGNVIVVGVDYSTGETISLNDEQIANLKRFLLMAKEDAELMRELNGNK